MRDSASQQIAELRPELQAIENEINCVITLMSLLGKALEVDSSFLVGGEIEPSNLLVYMGMIE